MFKRLIYLFSFVLVLALASNASAGPNLVAYYRLDGDAKDTGNVSPPADGELYGNPTWTTGRVGGSIDLDGDDYVDCSNNVKFDITDEITLACWIKTTSGSAWQTITTKVGGGYQGVYRLNLDGSGNNVFFTCEGVPPYNAWGEVPVNDGKWHHLAGVYDGAKLYLYVDGVEDVSADASGSIELSSDPFLIGGYDGYNGLIDDVQLYNRALAPEEIPQIMKGILHLALAYNPDPDDGQTDVPRDVVLSWTPGIYAPPINGHKVYFSENFDDVNDGIGEITQDANSYARPERLAFGKTYYWRVDEVNAPPTSHIEFKGEVWQFTTEPIAYAIENIIATASSTHQADMGPENTINGSGLDADDLHSTVETYTWLSGDEPNGAWIEYELDKVYKLHEMWVWNSNQVMESFLGFGLKDVTVEYSTNGTDYTTLGTTHEFVRAPGAPDYAHNTTVDFGGATAKYVRLTANSNWGGIMSQYGLSEVRFLYIPVRAREPQPESGATDVDVDLVLSFRAGREATEHDVYISTDEQAVIDGNAPVTTVTETSFGPLSLDLDTAYYWKINEVNEAEATTTWQGDIWNFTTTDHLVVDDFEDYNDYPPNEIWSTWIDGYGVPANGATVGYPAPDWNQGEHYVETTIVHGGEQAMPFFYSNTGAAAYSEGERTFVVPQDWTVAGVQTLAVHFHGSPGNTGQLYVKVNGTKVPYDGQAGNLALTGWQAWNIDLASSGASLQNVTKLAIGVDGNGASGTLYFDDIGLYPYERQFITPSEPDNAGLIGHWKFDGDTQDSSGRGNHGTSGVTPPAFVAGKVGSNAMDLRGADYVVIDGVVDDITSTNITLSIWIKTTQSDEGELIAANTATGDHPFMFGIQAGNPYVNDGGDTSFPPPINDDLWHLITYVRDGNTGYVYADGVLRGTYSSGFSLGSVTRWSIGQEWDTPNPSDFYMGAVDDARFYDYPLSEGEVAWLAGRTEPFDKPF